MSPSDQTLESRALTLLDEALDQPSAARARWLEDNTDDPALRARVMALLAAGDRGSHALRTGGAGEGIEIDPPDRIGAYRIVERLGEGGMGAVFRAERDAGDFKHVVAVKIIRPGVLSDGLVERFQRERQTLADLSHPNIARLFDGGETLDGQPFIIMELVDGRPITEWADARGLGLRERLGLFLDACEAVRFAHQNLIVHRDLTPANVLVTPEGAVKLIDFGIARPPEEGAGAGRDAMAAMSLTPGFAAPERMSGAGGSTLVDVYSLGRLIEELTAGQARDPDLAAIAAKATRERPEDRYASVDGLIDDVRRYLDGRPVTARGRGGRYVFAKFVGRHRRAVGAGAAAVVLLTAALVVTLFAYAAADRARAAEAQRFQEVRALAGYMLFDLNDQLERTPGNTAARVQLAAQAQRYLSALAETELADQATRLDTARGFIRLADIQGVPRGPNFGDHKQAEASLASAGRLLAKLEEEDVDPALVAPEQARAAALGSLVASESNNDKTKGKALLAEADRRLASVPAGRRGEAWHLARRTALQAQIDMAYLGDDLDEVTRLAGRFESDQALWPASLKATHFAEFDRALAAYWRGAALANRNEAKPAIAELLKARRMLAAVEAKRPNDPQTLYWMAYSDYELFAIAARDEQFALSTDSLLRARSTLARLLAVEDADNALKTLAVNMDEALSQDHANHGRFAEAIGLQKDVVRRQVGLLTRENRPATVANIGWSEMILGLNGKKAGDRALTCAAWTRAEARWRSVERDLQEFHAAFLPGLRANLKLCAEGRPLSAFKPLR